MRDISLEVLEQAMLERDKKFFEEETGRLVMEIADATRCNYKHNARRKRDFVRELRHGNPDCQCCVCDGYDEECPDYETARC